MKLEDRPVWWDIYRAFPPITEPLYARPVCKQTIRPIFYEEDNLRAKFHKSGQYLGTVNLLDSANKSYTQKLIDINTQLKAESTDFEEDLYDKCVATLNAELGSKAAERQPNLKTSQRTNDPRSVTSQIKENKNSETIASTSLKDIFKE